jgi:hypothetical protein
MPLGKLLPYALWPSKMTTNIITIMVIITTIIATTASVLATLTITPHPTISLAIIHRPRTITLRPVTIHPLAVPTFTSTTISTRNIHAHLLLDHHWRLSTPHTPGRHPGRTQSLNVLYPL